MATLDEMLAGLAGAGDQEALLRQNQLLAQKLRTDARARPMGSTGLGNLLRGAGGVLDVYRANDQEQAANAGLSDIRNRTAEVTRSLPTFTGPTPAQVFSEQDPDLMASSAALAGAGVQQRRDLARRLSGTGIKALTDQAAVLEQEAANTEKQLDPGVLKLTLQRHKDANEAAKLASALEKAGLHEQAATVRARIAAAAVPQYQFNPVTGGVVAGNRFTGDARFDPLTDPTTGLPITGKGGKVVDPEYSKFVYKTAPAFQSSRGVLGTDQNTANRIARAQILINTKKAADMTSQEVADVTLALAGVLTGGSVAARQTINELAYHTLKRSASEAISYLTNSPKSAEAEDFVDRIGSILANEYTGAKTRIKNEVLQPAIGLRKVLSAPGNRAEAEDYLRSFGMSDAELAQIFGGPQAAIPALRPAPPPPAAPVVPGAPKKVIKFDAQGNEVP